MVRKMMDGRRLWPRSDGREVEGRAEMTAKARDETAAAAAAETHRTHRSRYHHAIAGGR